LAASFDQASGLRPFTVKPLVVERGKKAKLEIAETSARASIRNEPIERADGKFRMNMPGFSGSSYQGSVD
jgi:hypothetical protein